MNTSPLFLINKKPPGIIQKTSELGLQLRNWNSTSVGIGSPWGCPIVYCSTAQSMLHSLANLNVRILLVLPTAPASSAAISIDHPKAACGC